MQSLRTSKVFTSRTKLSSYAATRPNSSNLSPSITQIGNINTSAPRCLWMPLVATLTSDTLPATTAPSSSTQTPPSMQTRVVYSSHHKSQRWQLVNLIIQPIVELCTNLRTVRYNWMIRASDLRIITLGWIMSWFRWVHRLSVRSNRSVRQGNSAWSKMQTWSMHKKLF